MAKTTLPLSSNHQPDPRVLVVLNAINWICFITVPLICGITLLVWFLPSLRHLMPYPWDAMKADTAIALLLGTGSLYFSQIMRSQQSVGLSRWPAAAMVLMAVAGWLDFLSGTPVSLAGLLSRIGPMSQMGRMSPNTASELFLLGMVLFSMRARKNLLSRLVDVCAILLVFLMVVFVSGYAYGALRLAGPSLANRMSPVTIICFCALSFAAFSRRAEYGLFSIFVGDGIGARILRLAAPFALALPFLLATVRTVLIGDGMEMHYATAITTATTSLLAFILIYFLARRIDGMEQEIRVLSLNDELTGLYNRRGFFLLAGQAKVMAQYTGGDFSILFLDVDNLKEVNDTLGHEVGNALLCEFAGILQLCFRESDVIGRLGGDEFVVAARANPSEIAAASHRLEAILARANDSVSRLYAISASCGMASAESKSTATLEVLLQQADASMYDRKRQKKTTAGSLLLVPVTVD